MANETVCGQELKAAIPRLPIMLLLDGLYPNGPVLRACGQCRWQFETWCVSAAPGLSALNVEIPQVMMVCMCLCYLRRMIAVALGMVAASCVGESAGDGSRADLPAAVEVEEIREGPIADVRTFSGALEAFASFPVSPKIDGLVEAVLVNIGDTVEQGDVVARLDDDEYRQALAKAKSDLLVAEANLAQAKSALEIAERMISRIQTLFDRGVASALELDDARNQLLTAKAQEKIFRAQVSRARAALKTAKIHVGYADIAARWQEDDGSRVVAERFVDEGEIVAAKTPLLRIVDLDPIVAVFFVTERDYPFLAPDQEIALFADAYPQTRFEGRIARIAPVFRDNSRQARVEVTVPNADRRLKPGMFVNAKVTVKQVGAATIVPADAIVTRADAQGVFVVAADGNGVSWRPVTIGVRRDGEVQVIGEGLTGHVVTLGQQLLKDGSRIAIGGKTDARRGESGAR